MKTSKLKQQTETKLKDQEEGTVKSNFGTLLILLSGIVIYVDKVVDYLDIQVNPIPYYGNLDVFLWTIGGTVSPLLLCIGYFFKPYKWSLGAPAAAYSIQMMYIFSDVKWIGKEYFWHYSALFFLSVIAVVFILDYFVKNYGKTIANADLLISKIRLVMDRLLDGRDYAKDKEEYTEKILKPTIKDLND